MLRMEIGKNAAALIIAQAVALVTDILMSSDEENDTVLEKTDNFYELTIQNFNDRQFQQHFRISTGTFEWLLHEMRRYEEDVLSPGRPKICLEKRILCFLWYLANLEAFREVFTCSFKALLLFCLYYSSKLLLFTCSRSVADRFGVSKYTAWDIFYDCCQKLLRLNRDIHIIKFPTGNSAVQVMAEFEAINGFPGIVGAIDGCHIRIEKPKVNGNSYINRKSYPSILLQGICDSKKMFLDVYAGEPGSIHDQRLYFKSDIFDKIRRRSIEIPNNGFLIGDLAYKLTTTVMVGFKTVGVLTNRKIRFNQLLSQNRMVIENAFGILKSRFRRLKHLETKRMDFIPLIIVAGCIMHNICQGRGDLFQGPIDEVEEDDHMYDEEDEGNNAAAQEKRENVMNFVLRNQNV